jgi:hypothetical protein
MLVISEWGSSKVMPFAEQVRFILSNNQAMEALREFTINVVQNLTDLPELVAVEHGLTPK